MIQDVPKIGRVYQLSNNSANPTRLAGRDENGIPREETLCALAKWERFVDTSGNVMDVPLQCGRVFDPGPEAERIDMAQRRDQIRAGCLPLNECPHTTKYIDWVGAANDGALVPLPDGEKACQGKKEPADHPPGVPFFGCDHMEKVIKKRRELARKRHDALQAQSADERTLGIAREVGVGVAQAMAATPGSAQRSRLTEGKGEK